jgi:hypothetical protein
MIIHYATVVADLDRARVMGLLAADDRLRGFVRDGRIAAIPVKQAKRLLLLDAVAQAFEPGVRYCEAVVSGFLATVHDDYAALRRYLVDGEFLSRDHGEYWRTAGTVDLRAPGRPAQVPGPGPPVSAGRFSRPVNRPRRGPRARPGEAGSGSSPCPPGRAAGWPR